MTPLEALKTYINSFNEGDNITITADFLNLLERIYKDFTASKKMAFEDLKTINKLNNEIVTEKRWHSYDLIILKILQNNIEIPLGKNTCYLIDKENLSKEENEIIEKWLRSGEEL